MATIGILSCTAVEANGIKSTNFFTDSSDTYCSIELKTEFNNGTQYTQRITSTCKKSLTPTWNETFEFTTSQQPQLDVLFISIFASKSFGDKVIGRVEVPITLVVAKPEETFDCWFKLLETKGKGDTSTPGAIHLILRFTHRLVNQIADPRSSLILTQSGIAPQLENPSSVPVKIERQTDSLTQPTIKQEDQLAACPICNSAVPLSTIEQHVNSCLDKKISQPVPIQPPIYNQMYPQLHLISNPQMPQSQQPQMPQSQQPQFISSYPIYRLPVYTPPN